MWGSISQARYNLTGKWKLGLLDSLISCRIWKQTLWAESRGEEQLRFLWIPLRTDKKSMWIGHNELCPARSYRSLLSQRHPTAFNQDKIPMSGQVAHFVHLLLPPHKARANMCAWVIKEPRVIWWNDPYIFSASKEKKKKINRRFNKYFPSANVMKQKDQILKRLPSSIINTEMELKGHMDGHTVRRRQTVCC